MVGIYFLAKDKDNQDQETLVVAYKEARSGDEWSEETVSTGGRRDSKCLDDEDYKGYGSFDKL